jgi:AWS domain
VTSIYPSKIQSAAKTPPGTALEMASQYAQHDGIEGDATGSLDLNLNLHHLPISDVAQSARTSAELCEKNRHENLPGTALPRPVPELSLKSKPRNVSTLSTMRHFTKSNDKIIGNTPTLRTALLSPGKARPVSSKLLVNPIGLNSAARISSMEGAVHSELGSGSDPSEDEDQINVPIRIGEDELLFNSRSDFVPESELPYTTIYENKYTKDNLLHIEIHEEKCKCKDTCDESCPNRYMSYECNENICRLGAGCSNRAFSKLRQGLAVELGVIPTSDCGLGCKAMQHLVKDQIIGEYVGEVITERQLEEIKRGEPKEVSVDSFPLLWLTRL